jgi:hypothetical protein
VLTEGARKVYRGRRVGQGCFRGSYCLRPQRELSKEQELVDWDLILLKKEPFTSSKMTNYMVSDPRRVTAVKKSEPTKIFHFNFL